MKIWRQKANLEEKRIERDESRNETAYCPIPMQCKRSLAVSKVFDGTDAEWKKVRWAKGSRVGSKDRQG